MATILSKAGSIQNKWLNIIAYAIVCYACIPNRFFAHVRYGADPSWQYALNTAVHKQYEFGKDFVFTYGPLGYLSSALPLYLADHGAGILLYKAVLYAGLVLLGIFALRTSANNWQKAAVLIIFIFAGRLYNYESSVYFLVLFVALLLWHQKKHKDYLLYIALVFACINFYIKLNTGLLLFALLGIDVVLLLWQKQLSLIKSLGMLLAGVVLIAGIAWITNTNLPAYISNGFEVVKYFSAAQVNTVETGSFTFIAALIILLGFALLWMSYIKKNYSQLSVWLNSMMMSLCLFMAFKQGFVRGSYNHQVSFFAAALILLLVFFILPNGWQARAIFQNISAIFILAFAAAAIFHIGIYGFGFTPFKDLTKDNETRIAIMPSAITKTIGNSTVDLLPFETMHLYYNHLNYTPRPIPQGYQAYSKMLDSMNAAYFENDRSPQYVLLSNGSIDNRHPFWDEYRSKLSIRANYTIIDSLWLPDKPERVPSLYWLLKKNTTASKALFQPTGNLTSQPITDTVYCKHFPEDALLNIYINPNMKGRLQELLFQPAILNCQIQYASGNITQHDAITPILAAGVPVGYRLEMDEDIARFLRNETPLPQNRIEKIWFTGDLKKFEKEIKWQLTKVQIND